jgi:hypothetical protein
VISCAFDLGDTTTDNNRIVDGRAPESDWIFRGREEPFDFVDKGA